MNTSIKNLQNQGFLTVTYPSDLRKIVNQTILSWEKFTQLPVSFKQGLPYSNNADGVGYELKSGSGLKGDRKENFDITTAGSSWIKKVAEAINNETALEFLHNSTNLVGVIKPLIVEFAQQAEKAFGLVGFAQEVEEGEDAFFIRFIHYFGDRTPGDEIASAHTDQSGFTLHLFESAPGLQCLTFDGKWIDMPVSEGETVIIPSMQMQLRSSGTLKALCHRVVATADTAVYGRFSAVCFVQLKKTQKYDKDRWGRLQEKEPGFNYSLSPEQFSELFKG